MLCKFTEYQSTPRNLWGDSLADKIWIRVRRVLIDNIESCNTFNDWVHVSMESWILTCTKAIVATTIILRVTLWSTSSGNSDLSDSRDWNGSDTSLIQSYGLGRMPLPFKPTPTLSVKEFMANLYTNPTKEWTREGKEE